MQPLEPLTPPAPPPGTALTVVVVDDHHRFRDGMAERLERAGVRVLGHAADGRAGVQAALRYHPDVVLMDLNMPDMSGVEATRRLLAAEPQARVLMLSVSDTGDDVADAMLAGACGYVVKSASIGELVAALHAARSDRTFLSPPVAAKLLTRWRALEAASRAASERDSLLSPREIEVLRLVAAGQENSEIAAALGISPNTVKRHVAAILSKLGTENRTQAAVLAVRRRLI